MPLPIPIPVLRPGAATRRPRPAVVAGSAAHDLGLAAWFGGSLLGAVGLNAATREVDDPSQRTRVADAAWFRWAPVVALAIPTHLVGTTLVGGPHRRAWHGPLGRTRAALTVLAVLATAETGRSGWRVVRSGDVPVATAVTPIEATPPEVAAAMRRLRVAQWLVPASTGALWLLAARQLPRRA